MTRLTDSRRRAVYGQSCTPANLVTVTTPWGVRTNCHRLVAARFLTACHLAATTSAWQPRRIDSYACRQIRGSTSTSLHAYGLAWDWFDRTFPQPVDVWGPTNAPPAEFLAVFARAGFTLGANFTRRQDYPHIEWAGGIPDPVTQPAGPPLTPAVVDVPLVRPITYTRLGEATGMRISTHLVDIPALDTDGRGWVDVPYPLERVVSVTGHGSSPLDDGYWPYIGVTFQPRGPDTRITLAGEPSQHVGIWVKILEEQ